MHINQNKIINYKKSYLGFKNFLIKHKRLVFALIFISSYLLLNFLVDFSSQSLVAHDEGLYARRSRLVEESSNWFATPFEQPHHKTIGSYWLIALSIRLFGHSETALRLPSILISILCLLITYLIALKISNKNSAFISVCSLSSMPLWIQYSRYASPDITFVFTILLIIYFFLMFLDSDQSINKFFYIFISGLFISTSFFIRSYMALVPLLGLTPFISYHLVRTKNIYKTIFLTGISIGSIPTFINLYFAFEKYGMTGINSLFVFAKKQAIGSIDFNNLLLIPLNYLYFTFPIGILILLISILTIANNKIKYPLLVYIYPFISLLILLFMSTTYPHYYLFLLPSFSIIFAVKLQSFSFRFSFSKSIIRYSLFFLIIFIVISFGTLLINYKLLLIQYSPLKILLTSLIVIFLALCFIVSIRHLFDNRYYRFDLKGFLFAIIVPQYISISLLYNLGIIGSPNYKLKLFLKNDYVARIIKDNTIYLYNVDSKVNTLLRYYLPSSKIVKYYNDVPFYNYIITSDKNFVFDYNNKDVYRTIKSFDNHFLLMNISK